MAKKNKKDELDDNEDINKDSNADFNEADDNFGLPEVDYQPIDRNAEEEEFVEEEPTAEESERASEEREYSSVEEREEIYATEDDDDYRESADDQPVYVPGSYKPPKDDSMVPKILALVFVILLAGLGIWYFGFERPAEEAKKRAAIEQQRKLKEDKDRQAAEQAERERQAAEQARREEEERIAAEEAKPKIGTIETISGRTGRYHVVIASAIDEDLAMDHAKKLSKEGVSTTIIEPFGKSKFHRIAVESHDTWAAAENSATELRSEYGEGVWVIKY